jgi:hypothetical protein
MHSILLLATRLWPDEHGGYLPTNFVSMSNELILPQLLFCAADLMQHPAESRTSFDVDHSSYKIITPVPGCKIHGCTGYADDRLLDSRGRLVRPDCIW